MLCLALLAPGHALAQFELDPPKGYTFGQPAQQRLHLGEEQMLRYFPEDSPEFLFRYDPDAHCRIGWPLNPEADGFRAEQHMYSATDELLLGGNPDQGFNDLYIAVRGLVGNSVALYDNSGDKPALLQELEFPSLSAEYVWLADLTGDGRSEIVISGMTGVSNGGGAFVLRMGNDRRLHFVTEEYDPEWPQQLWSFYGDMELLRTPDGKWVFKGISPVGRNLSTYFWSWFYEWDADLEQFDARGPSFTAEKEQQNRFFERLTFVLGDFLAHPGMYYLADEALEFSYGFIYESDILTLENFLEEDGTPNKQLIEDTVFELEFMMDERTAMD